MQQGPQPVSGGVSIVGPQPANPAVGQSAVETSSTLGGISDPAATNPASGTMNAKLGALMLLIAEQNEYLARVVELLEAFTQGDRNG